MLLDRTTHGSGYLLMETLGCCKLRRHNCHNWPDGTCGGIALNEAWIGDPPAPTLRDSPVPVLLQVVAPVAPMAQPPASPWPAAWRCAKVKPWRNAKIQSVKFAVKCPTKDRKGEETVQKCPKDPKGSQFGWSILRVQSWCFTVNCRWIDPEIRSVIGKSISFFATSLLPSCGLYGFFLVAQLHFRSGT